MRLCIRMFYSFVCIGTLLFSMTGYALEAAPKISDREVIESLVRLEGAIEANAKAIEANAKAIEANAKAIEVNRHAIEANREMMVLLRNDMNSEINSLRNDMNSGINSLRNDMNSEIKSLRDEILSFLMWGFGLLFMGMLILVGFILWDRRSTLKPVKDEIDELREKKVDRVIEAMKKLSEGDGRFADALRSVGLL